VINTLRVMSLAPRQGVPGVNSNATQQWPSTNTICVSNLPPVGQEGHLGLVATINPDTFFERCYLSDLPPARKEGKFCSIEKGTPVLSKGGVESPLPGISLQRTIPAPVKM
jgi:hypothetical protein